MGNCNCCDKKKRDNQRVSQKKVEDFPVSDLENEIIPEHVVEVVKKPDRFSSPFKKNTHSYN